MRACVDGFLHVESSNKLDKDGVSGYRVPMD